MKKLIIFGTGDIAELANFYFSSDSDYEVTAFTVDGEFIDEETYCDLPVVSFEDVQLKYPPKSFQMFIALSYSKLNQIRKDKYFQAKEKGYTLASYVSSHASVLNNKIGENCFILEDNTIQPFVTIGDNVTLWSGNHIGHHSTIKDHTFLASHIVVSGGVEIGESCFIGVNATLRDHIKIGKKCVLGAGTLILHDTEPFGLYPGQETMRSEKPSTKIKSL